MTNVNNTTHCVDSMIWETLRDILWWLWLALSDLNLRWKTWCIEEQGKVGNGVESVQPSDETQLEQDITKPENVDLPRRSVVKSPVQQDQNRMSIFCFELQAEWNRRQLIRKNRKGDMVTRRPCLENTELSELEVAFKKFWAMGNLSEV